MDLKMVVYMLIKMDRYNNIRGSRLNSVYKTGSNGPISKLAWSTSISYNGITTINKSKISLHRQVSSRMAERRTNQLRNLLRGFLRGRLVKLTQLLRRDSLDHRIRGQILRIVKVVLVVGQIRQTRSMKVQITAKCRCLIVEQVPRQTQDSSSALGS